MRNQPLSVGGDHHLEVTAAAAAPALNSASLTVVGHSITPALLLPMTEHHHEVSQHR
jgi:hypothetical protein